MFTKYSNTACCVETHFGPWENDFVKIPEWFSHSFQRGKQRTTEEQLNGLNASLCFKNNPLTHYDVMYNQKIHHFCYIFYSKSLVRSCVLLKSDFKGQNNNLFFSLHWNCKSAGQLLGAIEDISKSTEMCRAHAVARISQISLPGCLVQHNICLFAQLQHIKIIESGWNYYCYYYY